MKEWGLTETTDFNAADVKLNDELDIAKEVVQGGQKVKTRAYDFALPYKVPGCQRKILIQSQFVLVYRSLVDESRTRDNL
jgi:hypothetical protein